MKDILKSTEERENNLCEIMHVIFIDNACALEIL